MNVTKLALIATAVITSAVGGYVLGKHQTESEFERLFYLGEANQLTTRVQALSAIRRGRSEKAANWLEHLADGNIIALNAYKEIALRENYSVILSSLKLASTYRDIYREQYNAIAPDNSDVVISIKDALVFGGKHGKHLHKDFVDEYLKPNN